MNEVSSLLGDLAVYNSVVHVTAPIPVGPLIAPQTGGFRLSVEYRHRHKVSAFPLSRESSACQTGS